MTATYAEGCHRRGRGAGWRATRRTRPGAAGPDVGQQAQDIAEARDASAAADQSDPETAWAVAYMARVAEATDEQLSAMRPEIGKAVASKTISSKVAGELSAAVSARRRELAEATS